jgi:hypothetical protein
MIVFGGVGWDTWALTLGAPAWAELAPTGVPPLGNLNHTAIYDPVRDRMVVFGGAYLDEFNQPHFPTDVSALSLAGTTGWTALSTGGGPVGRSLHTAIYDPVRDRMVVFGGADIRGLALNDAWFLVWGAPVSVGKETTVRLRLGAPRPNPSSTETFVDFELAEPGRVILDVFDVRGCRVKRVVDAWLTAGPHVGAWWGDDDHGNALGSGVYFIRMQEGGFQATRRTVRVR